MKESEAMRVLQVVERWLHDPKTALAIVARCARMPYTCEHDVLKDACRAALHAAQSELGIDIEVRPFAPDLWYTNATHGWHHPWPEWMSDFAFALRKEGDSETRDSSPLSLSVSEVRAVWKRLYPSDVIQK